MRSHQSGTHCAHPNTVLGCATLRIILCHTAITAHRHICRFASMSFVRESCLVRSPICRSSLLCVSNVAVASYAANSGTDICQYGRHSCLACYGGHSRHFPAASLSHARRQPTAHVHVQQQGQDAEYEPCSHGSLPILRSLSTLSRFMSTRPLTAIWLEAQSLMHGWQSQLLVLGPKLLTLHCICL